MYCILITGIPAAGKSTLAQYLSNCLRIPLISKDNIKELLFDDIGFKSREEKVKLGIASMNVMYHLAEQLMKLNQPFILESNFEYTSKDGLDRILEKYSYEAITITLTGDYKKIYERYVERNESIERHRGHVVNDCYPEKSVGRKIAPIPFESFCEGIKTRGMDSFVSNGPQIIIDMTDFNNVDMQEIVKELHKYQERFE